jgi:hypothetical protein
MVIDKPTLTHNRLRYREASFWIALALLAVLGAGLVFYSTRLGIGLGDDSYVYIQPARSALAGEGLATNARYGTLLPVLLTAIGFLGIDPQDGFRLLNAALFGLNACLVGVVVRKMTRSTGFALVGAALFTFSESLLEIHSWGMSEPLHLFLTLLGFMCLAEYLENGSWKWLAAAALLVGLSAVARFVGWLSLPAGALVILAWRGTGSPGRLLHRAAAAGLYALGVAVLPGMAAVYNLVTSGYAFGARPVVWIQPDLRWFVEALGRWEIWVIPGRVVHGREILLAALFFLALAGILAWMRWKHGIGLRTPGNRLFAGPLPTLLLVFAVVFLGFHIVLMFTDNVIGRSDALNNRYMTPIQAVFWVLAAAGLCIFYREGSRGERRGYRPLIAALCAVLVVLGAARTVDMARTLNRAGMGYAAERWHHSETVAYLMDHPEVPLISTGNYGFYFWTGRLPRSISSFSSLEEMRLFQRETGAWLVVLNSMPPELYQIDPASLLEGQVLVQEFSEASIYRQGE